MAIQKTGPVGTPAQTTAPQRIVRTGAAEKSAFETALARKSAQMGQPAATTAGVDPATGMTPQQAQFVERQLGEMAARTILTMPQPKKREVQAEDGLDGE